MTPVSIPYGRQSINDDDIAAVTAVLQSDFLTQGPVTPRFEAAVVAYLDSRMPLHAVAVNSATSALHIACMALDVGPGDSVWTCANSFAASSNCALYCGAQVDFIDIDPQTLNMDVQALASRLDNADRAGTLPKVVIPVDFAGRSAPLKDIRALADRYGFAIIEDASHAIGGSYAGAKVAAHGLADITVFSFHPVKIITTAEGGMALTHRPDLAQRLNMLRTHGITREPHLLHDKTQGPWFYEQHLLGYNYRMTEVHAALGLSQLERIDGFVDARHAVNARYAQLLAPFAAQGLLTLPVPDDAGTRSALHLYPVQLGPQAICTRAQVFASLRSAGIGVNVHYLPIYWHPYYQQLGFKRGLCPNAEAYYEAALSLPMHAALDEAQLQHVTDALDKALSGAP